MTAQTSEPHGTQAQRHRHTGCERDDQTCKVGDNYNVMPDAIERDRKVTVRERSL